jgi:hypothetical protein
VATVQAVITDDIAPDAIRSAPPSLSTWGEWEPAGANFYNELARRYGFEQKLPSRPGSLPGGRQGGGGGGGARWLVDEVALVGPVEAVRDRLEVWRASGVSALAIASLDPTTLRGVVEAVG